MSENVDRDSVASHCSSVLPLVFGLDFDQTYTRDPDFFDAFVRMTKERGHVVWCVTSRVDNAKNRREVTIPNVETVFCGFASKVWHMRENLGIKIDIWIEDDPMMCVAGKGEVPIRRKQPKVWQASRTRKRYG